MGKDAAGMGSKETWLGELLDAVRDPAYTIDDEGRCTYVNQAALHLLGHDPRELVGQSVHAILHDGPLPECELCRLGRSSAGHGIPAELRRRDGTKLAATCSALALPDGLGTAVVAVPAGGSSPAVQLVDELTGLPTRTVFLDRLTNAVARSQRTGDAVAVLFVDLDRFMAVNDTLGHHVGDLLLVTVADRLRHSLRESDTVARVGGDEFVVLCDGLARPEDVTILADRVALSVNEPVFLHGRELRVGASIGVAVAGASGLAPEHLLRDADAAMYGAKQRGRGRWELFDAAMRTRAEARALREAELRGALERHELRLHYQPILDLRNERVVAVEALVRWEHPERGLLGPNEFIPLAEETGLILPLGAWVLEEACAAAARWAERARSAPGTGVAPRVSVNLSARQLADPDLAAVVEAALQRAGIEPCALGLEITETALMADARTTAVTVQALRDLGVHLSVDDFGTGYSSLLQLRHFQVQELKLDRYFVAGLGTNDEDTAIARSVIYLAHALGIAAVAEGVETPSQLALLRELGCDQAQGYSWSRAVPESHLLAWITPDGRWRARPYLVVAEDSGPDLAERSAPAAKRTNVVLIDDAAGDRRLVRHALERSGSFSVVGEAPDAASGIDLVAAHHPDLALLDLSMPGLGGLEALARIVGASPETKVVILSGFISPGIADAAMAGGASIYLDKNLPAARLVEELLVLAGAA